MLLLRLLAVLIAAVSGVFGILWNTRDPQGRLTRAGRVTLGIIVLAGVVGMTLTVKEHRDQEVRDKSAAEQTLQIVRDLERQLDRFTTLSVGYAFSLEKSDPFLATYLERVKNELLSRSNAWFIDDTVAPNAQSVEAYFGIRSPLAPTEQDGDVAWLAHSFVVVDIFAMPIDLAETLKRTGLRKSDIFAQIADNNDPVAGLKYVLDQQRLTVHVPPKISSSYKSRGTIKALSELAGAQLFLRILSPIGDNAPTPTLDSVTLKTDDGREVVIPRAGLTLVAESEPGGGPLFVHTFPKPNAKGATNSAIHPTGPDGT